jgi:4-hydroxy-tetrahydrodipicolinate synthase
MLYHIPPMATVAWSLDLVGRLIDAFPGVVVGMKDSSGDFEHTRQVIEAFPDFAVFPGAEVYLVKALAAGAAGCISASANINAAAIAVLIDHWREPDAERRQAEVNAVRKAVETRGLIPAIKAVLAARYGDDAWLTVRPPLMKIDAGARAALLSDPAIVALLETVAA